MAETLHDFPVDHGIQLGKRVLRHLVKDHLASQAATRLIEELLGRKVESTVFDELAIPILASWPRHGVIVLCKGFTRGGVHAPHEAVRPHSRDQGLRPYF